MMMLPAYFRRSSTRYRLDLKRNAFSQYYHRLQMPYAADTIHELLVVRRFCVGGRRMPRRELLPQVRPPGSRLLQCCRRDI